VYAQRRIGTGPGERFLGLIIALGRTWSTPERQEFCRARTITKTAEFKEICEQYSINGNRPTVKHFRMLKDPAHRRDNGEALGKWPGNATPKN